MSKTTDQELDFGTNLLDIDEIINHDNTHACSARYSPESKLMTDDQIRELWERSTTPKPGKRVHGDIPETYEEFYRKVKESQNTFLKEINHND